MSNYTANTSREERTVASLVDMIKRSELKLPEMQRGYVWTSTQVRDLIDSLYRGYPSGAILMWEAEEQDATRDLQVAQEKSAFSTHKLLLDGQQRLTSLSAVLRNEPVQVRNRNKPIHIAFNLDHPDSLTQADDDIDNELEEEVTDTPESKGVQARVRDLAFAVASSSVLSKPNWIPVSRVFSDNESEWSLLKPLVGTPEHPNYTKYTERIRALKAIANYTYVVQVLGRKLSYEEVTAIFVRVNSAGAKLRGSDLALAQITSKWPGSLALFEHFLDSIYKQSKWDLDTGIIVRSLVVFATGQSRFKTVGNIPRERLEEAWQRTQIGIEGALNFLRSNAGLEDVSMLSSRFYIIAIAWYFAEKKGVLSHQDTVDMLRWLYSASIRAWYSASTETTLDSDLSVLRNGGSFGDLAKQIEQTYGVLYITAEDLKERGKRSPLFTFSYLACKYHGAVDWESGAPLSLFHQGHAAHIEFHHIFPKSLLQKTEFSKAQINEIANMAFLSGKANRGISNKSAHVYLPTVVNRRGEMALQKQGIPTSVETWNDYASFLNHRRTALAAMINAFIRKAASEGQATQVPLEKSGES
ncbi:MAG TPA: DUF262 domain-containing protein [Acidobacteriaceae bacterium]|jgi:hypothetical protein|nr:DUF262 domain-containing protein [Acidobacteriaceae bacterium]